MEYEDGNKNVGPFLSFVFNSINSWRNRVSEILEGEREKKAQLHHSHMLETKLDAKEL